jgi:orotate phosphoribosyltransferase
MNDLSYNIIKRLLDIQAIKFNFKEPFVWTSGWKAPVYCDNRASLSNHQLRSMVKDAYSKIIREKFPDAEVIAGVATGAIAQGALVADELKLPLIYVREKRKEHGLKRIIEGFFEKGQKTVILEDHISTGGSSLKAWNELKIADADVLGMVAAFSYDFAVTKNKFSENNCILETISTFATIKEVALKEEYITKEESVQLELWHSDPQSY